MNIETLREMLGKGTKGPWSSGNQTVWFSHDAYSSCESVCEYVSDDNAQLIVTLRNVAEELLAVVEAARAVHEETGNGFVEWDTLGKSLAALTAKLETICPAK